MLSLKGGPPQPMHETGGGGGGGGWGQMVGGLGGMFGAALGSRGQREETNAYNKYINTLLSANFINKGAKTLNPWIWDAIQGRMGTGGTQFQTDLYNILQGKDISPYLLSRPLNQINQGANQNLARFQSLVGRNNAGGGLANAYGLANLGGRNTAVADLMNRYGQWREQQRRSDINWGLGQVQNSQEMALRKNAAQANLYKQPISKYTGYGAVFNGLAAGMAGSPSTISQPIGTTGSPNGSQYSYPGNSPGQNQFVGSLGSQGNWYSYPGATQGNVNQQNYINSLGSSGSWYNPYATQGGTSTIQTGGSPNWYSASNYWQ